MRLITWNCRGGFAKKHDSVAGLHPDILIVQECRKMSGVTMSFDSKPARSFEWFGNDEKKGVAVLSYGDYSLQVHPSYNPTHQWIIPLIVSGPMSFLLLAVWTVPLGTQGGRYVRPLFEAFECYKALMNDGKVMWAGDFNANPRFDTPSRRYKFTDFAALLADHGMRSVYHRLRSCEHGEESEHTFFQYAHADKGHHIDHIFSTADLHPNGSELSVGSHSEWGKLSDHMPVICDFH